ncbi:hypothetical protein D3C80_1060050 [compost metagenome]
MAVQNTAHGVGDRLVMVAAVHQDGEQGGDRPGLGAVGADRAGTGALQQLGQFGEDGRRIALGGRRLARGQTDLALGHGEAGDAVHQAQDFQPLIAQVFRDGQGHIGRLAPFQRRLVRGGDDDDGALQALFAQGLLDELADLAAPLADQADDHDVAGGLLGQHGQQHRLAHARTGEDAQALAPAGGGEDVHRADAQVQPLAHPTARMGRGRRGAQGIGDGALRQRPQAVDGQAEGVDDAAQPGGGGAHAGGGVDDADVGAGGHALDRAEGHQQGLGVAETDDLGGQGGLAAPLDLGAGADRQTRQAAARFNQQAADARHLAGDDQRVDRFDGGDEIAQEKEPLRAASGDPNAAPLSVNECLIVVNER